MIEPAAYHLAQVNIARMRAPLDDPQMEGFARQLEFINACAERSPGFVWRLQTDDGDATGIDIFGDSELLINLSVWVSVEALGDYGYKSAHRQPLKERRSWFLPIEEAHLALWWVSAGHRPSVAEAEKKLLQLRTEGPTSRAFTFQTRFPAPGRSGIGSAHV